MVKLRSGRVTSRSYTSIDQDIQYISHVKDWTLVGPRAARKPNGRLGFKKASVENRPDPYMKLAENAFNYFNQNNPQKYKLLKRHSVKHTLYGRFAHYHINFTAENTDIVAAPVEMFFAELTKSSTEVVSVRLCVSLGPENSLSGDKLNGCFYCRVAYDVWHPKDGGFARGADATFKTVPGICDNQKNAIPDQEKHLHKFKQVYQSLESKQERSEQVDDASLYATEALNYLNQRWKMQYELVKLGFGTRVFLPTCLLFHVNFTAKDTNNATAPEEIFFAEVISTGGVIYFGMCTIVDSKELLLASETGDKMNGCYYCLEFNNVQHPVDGGFVRGGDSLFISEEELEKTQPA